jgi:hypothetical protein
VELAAIERDICGRAIGALGRAVYPDLGDDAARKQAKRDLAAGRELLHADGVLPWAAYARGELPLKWWCDAEFERAVRDWRVDAMVRPAERPPSAEERLHDELLRVALPGHARAALEYVALSECRREAERRIDAAPWRWRRER